MNSSGWHGEPERHRDAAQKAAREEKLKQTLRRPVFGDQYKNLDTETKETLTKMRNVYERTINTDLKQLTETELSDLIKEIAFAARRYYDKDTIIQIPEPYNWILYDYNELLMALSAERNRRLQEELIIMRAWRNKK